MPFYSRQLIIISFLLCCLSSKSLAQAFPEHDQLLAEVASLMNKGLPAQAEKKIKNHTNEVLGRGSIEEYYKSLTMLYRVLRSVEESKGKLSSWYYFEELRIKTKGPKALFTDLFRLRILREYYLNLSETAVSWIHPQTDWTTKRLQQELLDLQQNMNWKSIDTIPLESLGAIFTQEEETIVLQQDLRDFFVSELLNTWMLIVASENSTYSEKEYEKLDLFNPYLAKLYVQKTDPIQYYLPLHKERRELLRAMGRLDALAYHDFLLIKHAKFYLDNMDYYEALKLLSGQTEGLVSDMIRLEMAEHLFYNMPHHRKGLSPSSYSIATNLLDGLKATYPRKHFLHNNAIILEGKIRAKSLSLDVYPEPYSEKGIIVRLRHKNVDSIYLRLCYLPQDLKSVLKKMGKAANKKPLVELSESLLLEARTERLMPAPDFFEKTTIVGFDPRPEGTYFILASDDENFEKGILGIESFQVVDASLFAAYNERGDLFLNLRNKSDFKPALDYDLELFDRDSLPVAFSTNSNPSGFEVLEGENKPTFFRLSSAVSGLNKGHEAFGLIPSPVQSQDTFDLKIYTDRAVYEKGDTIYFKMLLNTSQCISDSLRSGMELPVYLGDSYGVYDSLTLYTDSFGAANGHFVIPDFDLEGLYIWTAAPVYCNAFIDLKEVKLSTFSIFMEEAECIVDSLVQLGFAIKANYHTADPVRGKLKYTISFNTLRGELAVVTASADLDENGNFEFRDTFEVQGDNITGFRLDLELVDIKGERQTLVYRKDAAEQKASIYFESQNTDFFPEEEKIIRILKRGADLKESEDYRLELFKLGDLDNKPLNGDYLNNYDYLNIKPSRLAALFPHIISLKESSEEKIFERKVVFDKNNSDSLNLSSFNLLPGSYKILVKKDGQLLRQKSINIIRPGKNKGKGRHLFLESPKDTFFTGDSLQLNLAYTFELREVYYRLYSNCTVFESGFMSITELLDKRWYLDEAMEGVLYVELSTMKDGVLLRADLKLNVIPSIPSLDIYMEKQVSPGELFDVVVEWKGGQRPAAFFYTVYHEALDEYGSLQWEDPYPTSYLPRKYNMYSLTFSLGGLPSFSNVFLKHDPLKYLKPKAARFRRLREYGLARNDHRFPFSNGFKPYFMLKGEGLDYPVSTFDIEASGVSYSIPAARTGNKLDFGSLRIRNNKKYLATFNPLVKFDQEGRKKVSFEAPDALGRWKLVLCAYDEKGNSLVKEMFFNVTKELMLIPDYPRVLRSGDEIDIKAKVLSKSGLDEVVNATLEILSGEDLVIEGSPIQSIQLHEGQALLTWRLKLQDISAEKSLKFLVKAASENVADAVEGEIRCLPSFENEKTVHLFYLDKKEVSSFPESLNGEEGVKRIDITLLNQPFTLFMDQLADILLDRQSSNDVRAAKMAAWELYTRVSASYPDFREAYASYLRRLEEQLSTRTDPDVPLLSFDDLRQKLQLHKSIFGNVYKENASSFFQNLKNGLCPNGGFAWYGKENPNLEISVRIYTILNKLESEGIILYESPEDFDFGMKEYIDSVIIDSRLLAKDVEVGTQMAFLNLLLASGLSREYNFEIRNLWKLISKQWATKSLKDQIELALIALQRDEGSFAMDVLNSIEARKEYDKNKLLYWNDASFKEDPSQAVQSMLKMYTFLNQMDVNPELIEAVQRRILMDYYSLRLPSSFLQLESLFYLSKQLNTSDKGDRIVIEGQGMDGQSFKNVLNAKAPSLSLSYETLEEGGETSSSIIFSNKSKGSIPLRITQWKRRPLYEGQGESHPYLTIKRQWYFFNEKDSLIRYRSGIDSLKQGDKLVLRLVLQNDLDLKYLELSDEIASGLFPINKVSPYVEFSGFSAYREVDDKRIQFRIDYLPKGSHIIEIPYYYRYAGNYFGGYSSIRSVFAPSIYARTREQSFEE